MATPKSVYMILWPVGYRIITVLAEVNPDVTLKTPKGKLPCAVDGLCRGSTERRGRI